MLIKKLFKIFATFLMFSAIIWEITHDYYLLTQNLKIFPNLDFILWLARFALFSHAIEAIIAAYWAKSQQENPLTYGIYTFFVGTIALKELFRDNQTIES